jgi:molecular chaperone HtpG
VSEASQSFPFQAEVSRVLDLVIHSLYRNSDIFLRELISNASDALDKLRFEAITRPELLAGQPLEIRVEPNADARTLTISDSGIGMTRAELVENLGTIARSGTRAFLEAAKQARESGDLNLIGQFGVGFYSAFLVADQVTVTSRAAGSDEAWVWTSRASEGFTITAGERATHGTTIVLHLKEGQTTYAERYSLRRLIEKYSDYVSHPILIPGTEEGAWDTVNQAAALWQRNPADVTAEQYEEFYRHLTHDFDAPLAHIHFKIEGAQLFRGLLFIPKRPPFDLFDRESKHGVRLYVRRVFIMDNCDDLLPVWLRFIRGVIDSDDLPLNVSREVLQDSRLARTIRRQVVKKVLDLFEDLAANRPDDYRVLWQNYGRVLKEGLHYEPEHKDRLAPLCRFVSSHGGEPTSLRDYVSRMPEGQGDIWYAVGATQKLVEASPHAEAVRKRGWEVLYLTDAIDTWAVSTLSEFDGKPLKSVQDADADPGESSATPEKKAEEEKRSEELRPLTERFRDYLGGKVAEVKLSRRLSDSPACLVTGEGGLPPHIERMLRASNQEIPASPRVLELNPEHPVVRALEKQVTTESSPADIEAWFELLYGQAQIAEGSPLDEPARFNAAMSRLMARNLG